MRNSGKLLAMKVLDKDAIIRGHQLEHTLTERHVLEAAKHPFLVSLKWAFQTEVKLYLILDYLPGGELFFHLEQIRTWKEDHVRFYAAEVLLALGHLHSLGVVYRDLKPENILLDAEGHIRLTDFGLAKQAVLDNTSASTFCGTPEYLGVQEVHYFLFCIKLIHSSLLSSYNLGSFYKELDIPKNKKNVMQLQRFYEARVTPPFFHTNVNIMYSQILHQNLQFPQHMSPVAQDLLKKMLVRDPERRLGASTRDCRDIQEHPFFAGVHWDAVLSKQITPPIIPYLKGEDDVSNFNEVFTKEQIIDASATLAFNKVIAAKFDSSLFKGFSYSPN
eukprot:SM000096S24899  [mRNA]  locus=s96:388792:390912:+ [translate_table: standard]